MCTPTSAGRFQGSLPGYSGWYQPGAEAWAQHLDSHDSLRNCTVAHAGSAVPGTGPCFSASLRNSAALVALLRQQQQHLGAERDTSSGAVLLARLRLLMDNCSKHDTGIVLVNQLQCSHIDFAAVALSAQAPANVAAAVASRRATRQSCPTASQAWTFSSKSYVST